VASLAWGSCARPSRVGEAGDKRHGFTAGPTRSYAGTKRQLNNWLYTRMAEQLELEAQIQREMAGSDDFLEGAMAFVEKRAARFSGN
jgi:2-(1,2-epoxy-1,2-dihydrophenyl)acetyl-CoA isomerase